MKMISIIVFAILLSGLMMACVGRKTAVSDIENEETQAVDTTNATVEPTPEPTSTTKPTPEPTPNYIELVKAYETATNAFDLESIMAMFTESAEFEMVGQGTLVGKEPIQAIADYGIGIKTKLTFADCTVTENSVTCTNTEQNDWLVAAGLDNIFYPSVIFTFTKTGEIQKIVAALLPEDGMAMGGVLVEYIPWLLAERSDEATQLFGSEGQFVYSRKNGELNVTLVQEWQLIQIVTAYAVANSAHDVDTVMAMFTEDAEFELVGQGTLPNPEAIRAIHEYDEGINTRITFQNCSVESLTVTCEAVEQNDWLSTANVGEIFYPSSVFTLTETGKIQKITATISAEDGAAMGGVLAEFIPWLMTDRPEESAPLFTPEGQFVYSEANGILVVNLLAQWQAESG